jgi:hypothetical protein
MYSSPDDQTPTMLGMGFCPVTGLRPQQIQTELSDLFHEHTFQMQAVEKWRLRVADRTRDLEDEPRSGRSKKTNSGGSVPELFCERSFTLCNAIRQGLNIPKTARSRVSHEELGLTQIYLRQIPHTLDVNQMVEWITLSHRLLQMLQSDEEQNFRNLITGMDLGSSWKGM